MVCNRWMQYLKYSLIVLFNQLGSSSVNMFIICLWCYWDRAKVLKKKSCVNLVPITFFHLAARINYCIYLHTHMHIYTHMYAFWFMPQHPSFLLGSNSYAWNSAYYWHGMWGHYLAGNTRFLYDAFLSSLYAAFLLLFFLFCLVFNLVIFIFSRFLSLMLL